MDHPNIESLSLHEEDEEGFRFDFDEEEDDQVDLRWCLVGRFLCDRTIHFNSMKVRMADLWKPVKGVTIKEATDNKFLFHFAHPLDMEAVLKGGPWTFDNNVLILEQVQLGMQIDRIPLFHVDMWVQIHDLPMGLMKETIGTKLANYIGAFVEYDKNNNTSFWRQFMRVRVRIDVRVPLKKDTKVMNKQGGWCTVKFKYEKLGIFCFVCGLMGHAENKCLVRFSMEEDNGVREWSSELRAENRRQGGKITSRWLREEKGNRDGHVGPDTAAQNYFQASSTSMEEPQVDVATGANPGPSISPNPFQLTLTTRQEQSLATNATPNTTPNQALTNINDSANHYQIHPSFQTLLARVSTDPTPIITTADNLKLIVPSNNTPSTTTINSPIITPQHFTKTSTTISSPNHSFTFNSQPTLIALSATSSNPTNENHRITPNPLIARNPIKHGLDPKMTRPIQPKKSKNYPPKTKPSGPEKTQKEQTDMEVQSEKKRRRDDATSLNSSMASQSFLTAGPGSQACRDQ
jgi:hypothetical protein